MRPYQRVQYKAPPLTSTVKWLMIALFAIFVAQVIIRAAMGFDDARYFQTVERQLGVYPPETLTDYKLWQPLTYMFLHSVAGLGHIFFNLLTLYFFGPPLEARFGRKRFLVTFVSAGVAGGLAVLLADALGHVLSSSYQSATVLGASGAVSGVVGAICWIWRKRKLNLFFFEAKGWHLLVAFIGIDVLRALMGTPVAVSAHLGGIGMGVLIGANLGPYALFQRMRLARMRRKLRSINGGKDDRDWMN